MKSALAFKDREMDDLTKAYGITEIPDRGSIPDPVEIQKSPRVARWGSFVNACIIQATTNLIDTGN